MVEDDDDVDDNASDAFGLDHVGRVSGRRNTNATMGGRRESSRSISSRMGNEVCIQPLNKGIRLMVVGGQEDY